MNDKIKELAQTATEWCQENAHGTPVAWEWEDKFAELIVRECIKLCEAEREQYLELSAQNNGRESDFAFGSVNSSEHIALSIRLRFGVEE